MLCKQFRFDWKLFGKHDHSKRSSVHFQSPINVRIPIDFLHIFPLHSDRPDCDMFLFAFFLLTLIYISFRCIQLFFTLLVTLELKFYEVISSSRNQTKQNRRLKFFEQMEIGPTLQDVLQM